MTQQESTILPSSAVHIINTIVEQAQNENASDIHIDPTDSDMRIRFRIDGLLVEKHRFSKNLHSELISRIKIMAKLRTDEHRMPQDGRFRTSELGTPFLDMRVSITPTFYGENAVLRLLRDNAAAQTLSDLGLPIHGSEIILKALKKTYGMILATGPTGSGKTTTLYTLLKILNTPDRSIVTIEDPIEYSIEGIRQIQTHAARGFTFAQGLRTIVRQDPDIIMLGEIRDSETAYSAITISLTGHILLSTMHTNDACTALPRLLDMGIDPYLVASTVDVVIGQRLIRTLCTFCKKIRSASNHEQKLFQVLEIWEPGSCSECNYTGFKGRIGMYEILEIDEGMKRLIMEKAPAHIMKQHAISNGLKTMLEDGYRHAATGLTTFQEVLGASMQ